MNFEFGDGKVVIDIIEYLQKILDSFSIKFDKNTRMRTLASVDLFNKGKTEKLDKEQKRELYRTTTQYLYTDLRVQPNI